MIEGSQHIGQHDDPTAGGGEMQNDIDLIRKIMQVVHDRTDLVPRIVEIEGYDPVFVARHVERLHDAGFIEGNRRRHAPRIVDTIRVRDLTLAGHTFLAGMKEDTVWAKVKAALGPAAIASMALGKLAELTQDVAIKQARTILGLD